MEEPVPITKEVSQRILDALSERGIEYVPNQQITELDTLAKKAGSRAAKASPTTCSSPFPSTGCPESLRPRGLAVEGWIPVERSNFATRFGDVYAVGDVAGAPVAKAGVFAEAAAAVVAADIAARLHDEVLEWPWDGADHCYIEFGAGAVGKVEANFLGGPAPSARLVGPSPELAAERRPSARPDGSAGSGELGGEVMAALNRSIANDQDALEAWGRFFRLPASPAVTSAVTRMLLELDIRDVLPAISSPTLLLHRHGNPLFPPEAGRNVARRVDKHAQQPTN